MFVLSALALAVIFEPASWLPGVWGNAALGAVAGFGLAVGLLVWRLVGRMKKS